jgi:hypothetical protein
MTLGTYSEYPASAPGSMQSNWRTAWGSRADLTSFLNPASGGTCPRLRGVASLQFVAREELRYHCMNSVCNFKTL